MSRKKSQPQLPLFEPQPETNSLSKSEESQKTEKLSSTSSEKRIAIDETKADLSPHCGGASLATLRPNEHEGCTRYCIGKCGSYFTPIPIRSFDDVATVAEDEAIEVSASKYDQEKLFNHPIVEATGKTVESLEYSRAMITEVMRKFNGELPQSIMKADKKSRGSADLGTGSYDASTPHKGVWGVSGRGCANGALSVFPQNIGRALLLLYTEEGDTVFDPFAGHNSRMEFCVKAKRNYIGCDISKRFMEFNREQAKKLQLDYPEIHIELHEIDSRKCGAVELQEKADFTITSPPYYDIEDYGDEYQQLGKSANYFEFVRSMSKVAQGNFSQLKTGAFCVYFINDFRRENKFHAYHIDTYNFLKEAGFTPWDMLITDLGQPLRACFPAQVIEAQILPKRHEYGIVMRKL